MPIDILVFAAVAGFLFFKLREVLGKRTGHEKTPERAAAGQKSEETSKNGQVIDIQVNAPLSAAENAEEKLSREQKDRLRQIEKIDPRFDLTAFKKGALAAFEEIVTAFARNDKAALKPLLRFDVYDGFSKVIDAREKVGEVIETTLIAIKRSEIVGVELSGTMARITATFVTEQTNITRNIKGDIIDGAPGQIEAVNDVWTFERDLTATDPNWLLCETRSQDE